MLKGWTKHLDDAYFNDACCYAGKDHTKNNKSYICTDEYGVIHKPFKTIESAMKYADELVENQYEI